MTNTKIVLKKLRRHSAYDPYIKTIAGIDYLLKDPALLSPVAMEILLNIMPIVAVKRGSTYHYISGHRSYAMAVQIFGVDETISAVLVTRLSEDQIKQYVTTDILLPQIVVGFRKKSHLGKILKIIKEASPKIYSDLLNSSTQTQIAATLGCSKNTIFPPKNSGANHD